MRIVLLFILIIFHVTSFCSSWQQQVDYDIHCRLDDQKHALEASMSITYHNHSSQPIHHLMMHTWMNSFSHKSSPYSKQLDHLNLDSKLTLDKKDEGGYTLLTFNQNHEPLSFQFVDASHEILSLQLNQDCLPGDSITFHVSFILDIPKNISRGGHLGQSYQMTQWYPKVALLDSMGWHTMPYLELGEFYNEFGNYKVTIELPSNYKVAATGMLQTKEEIQFLNRYSDSCMAMNKNQEAVPHLIPASSDQYKSLEFNAQHVIDFAWFADKSFLVHEKDIEIGHRIVRAWSYFYPLKIQAWNSAATYCEHAIKYFSEFVGPYPYPQVTVVECNRPGSDGMEYPMITLIDQGYDSPPELEKVIIHEIGHNWFQAVIATDERNKAWMDEGLVTYYEHRYATSKGLISLLSLTPWTLNSDFEKTNNFQWYIQAARNRDIASISPVDQFSINGYVESIYEKPAKGLALMEKSLGTERFDSLMKSYYSKWQFRHPSDLDLLAMFRSAGVDWFDKLYLNSNKKANVAIKPTGVGHHITISHDQDFSFPIELSGYIKEQKKYSRIIPSLEKQAEFDLADDSIQYFIADPDLLLPEKVRKDNILRQIPSPYAPKAMQLHFLPGIGHSITQDIYLNPVAGYNVYDGFIPGIALHNLTLPASNFLFAGMLGYGLRSHKLTVEAGLEQHILINSSGIDRLTASGEFRMFSMNESTRNHYKDRYFKIAPQLKVSIKPKTQYGAQRELSMRPIYIGLNYVDPLSDKVVPDQRSYWVNELKFDLYNPRTLHPFAWNITAEMGRGFNKLYSSFKANIPYKFAHHKSGELRLFAGTMHQNENASIHADFQVGGRPGYGIHQFDYKFDELLFGRNESTASISQQVFAKDAAIYTLAAWPSSETWMISASYRTMIPGPLPLMPYIQFATYPTGTDRQVQFLYNGGVSLILIKNIFELNFPLIQSKSPIGDAYGTHKTYIQRCTFTFNLKALSPFKWINRISS